MCPTGIDTMLDVPPDDRLVPSSWATMWGVLSPAFVLECWCTAGRQPHSEDALQPPLCYVCAHLCTKCMQYQQRPEGGRRVPRTVIHLGTCDFIAKIIPGTSLVSEGSTCKLDSQIHRPFGSKAFPIRVAGLTSQNTGVSHMKPSSPSQ